MNITKNTGTVNTTYKAGRSIKYIVLHYTAGTKSTKGSASSVASYFKSGNAGGSADFIVDDETIVQYNSDIKNRYCWAVGGSKYTSMSTSVGGKYYNKCTNTNSISIEMCSNKTNKSNLGSNDTDWYLTDKTISNAAELTKYLMQTYNIPASNVIMHHHVTGKVCPNPWCVNESRLSQWQSFKNRLTATSSATKSDVVDTTITVSVNGKAGTYKAKNVKGSNYVEARKFLTALGYSVGFNSVKKRAMVTPSVSSADSSPNGEAKLTLDVETIIEDGTSYVHLRNTVDFLNKYDGKNYTVAYDKRTKVVTVK